MTRLMNYRKKMGRRAMSEEAEGYGYPFNAFYSFDDTSSGLPSPCEDLIDQEFEGEDEVFGSNAHLANGIPTNGDDNTTIEHAQEEDKETATPADSPKEGDVETSFPPTPERKIGDKDNADVGVSTTTTTTTTLNSGATKFAANGQAQHIVIGADEPEHTIDSGNADVGASTATPNNSSITKLEFAAANGQAQPINMGPEKPVDVGVASKGRFGALSQTKESTYNGVVNTCHYSSTKGSETNEEEEKENE